MPNKLDLDGTYNELIEKLYGIFCKDIKQKDFKYKGVNVEFDRRFVDSRYEEGFWHLITRNDKGDNRLVDFKRAKRLTWLRPLIEHCDDSEILQWCSKEHDKRGNRVEKTYIWYKDGQYLIILEKKKNAIFCLRHFM